MNAHGFVFFPSVVALMLAAALGCDSDDNPGTTDSGTESDSASDSDSGTDPCGDDGPFCLQACGSDIEIGATCSDGAWTCQGGVDADTCGEACQGPPPPCLEACGSDISLGDAVCAQGAWLCDEGVLPEALECGDIFCTGEEPGCLEACGSDIDLGPATCDMGTGNWSCEEGIDSNTCPDLCADPVPQCVMSCESDALYEAECIDTGWDCGKGVPWDSCP